MPGAIATVDLANSAYGLMQRLLAHAYAVAAQDPDKMLALDLAIGLMHALAPLAERAARLPVGPSNPACHAGVSFITLRDASALPPGPGARRFFCERMRQLADAAARLNEAGDARTAAAASILLRLAQNAAQDFDLSSPSLPVAAPAPPAVTPATPPPSPTSTQDGIEQVEGEKLTLALRSQPVHPRALLRDRRAHRIPRQRARSLDPPRHDGCRTAGGHRPRLSFRRNPLQAARWPAR